ncbi:hypothetical protein HYT84_03735 [Candidatus Micrarchaeota archaeon]|nr:hypothetical protein [Candidatus Micrarchaeota archaeon]
MAVCTTLPPINFDYYTIIAAVTIFMAVYIGIKQLASRAINKPEWEASANVELWELIYSILILIGAFAFFQGSIAFACYLTGISQPPTQAASAFLQKVLFKGILEAINDIFTIQVFYSIYNTFNFRPHEATWTWTYKIAPGADAVVGVTNVLGFALVAVFGSVASQIAILSIIDATMYTLILPAGLIMRFFPPTREAGVFLIVLAFGFQIVFPTVYVMNAQILDELWQIMGRGPVFVPYVSTDTAAVLKWSLIGSAALIGAAGGATITVIEGLSKFVGLGVVGGTLGSFLGGATMEAGAYSLTFIIFKPILMALGEVSVVALFLPAISTMFTFSFINGVTKFLLSKTT